MSKSHDCGKNPSDSFPNNDAEWGTLGPELLFRLLDGQYWKLDTQLDRFMHRADPQHDAALTADDVRELRLALYDFIRFLEDDLVPHVDGAEPYQLATGHIPTHVLAESLGLTMDEVKAVTRTRELDGSEDE
jgi:hypothetical protein